VSDILSLKTAEQARRVFNTLCEPHVVVAHGNALYASHETLRQRLVERDATIADLRAQLSEALLWKETVAEKTKDAVYWMNRFAALTDEKAALEKSFEDVRQRAEQLERERDELLRQASKEIELRATLEREKSELQARFDEASQGLDSVFIQHADRQKLTLQQLITARLERDEALELLERAPVRPNDWHFATWLAERDALLGRAK